MNTLYAEKFLPAQAEIVGDLDAVEIFYDGHFLKGGQAALAVWDHGLLYGDAAMEGIRVHAGGIFRLGDHLDRLYASCNILRIDPPLNRDEFKDVIIAVTRRNKLTDAHIRPIVTRGVGIPTVDPTSARRPSVLVLGYRMPPTLGSKPLRVTVSAVRRKAPQAVDARIKSLNYLDSILAKLQANAGGYDDALMLDTQGLVAEAASANIFCVRDNELETPFATAALPGITRATVLEIAHEVGIPAYERPMTVGDVYTADEAFLCGTGVGIVPIAEVDGRPLGFQPPGPTTSMIAQSYNAVIHNRYRTEVDYDM